jgi:hypothetical protein
LNTAIDAALTRGDNVGDVATLHTADVLQATRALAVAATKFVSALCAGRIEDTCAAVHTLQQHAVDLVGQTRGHTRLAGLATACVKHLRGLLLLATETGVDFAKAAPPATKQKALDAARLVATSVADVVQVCKRLRFCAGFGFNLF